ncbi:hypothetical protein WDW37_05205 [Bdellovibrionota bacterium FG-1]
MLNQTATASQLIQSICETLDCPQRVIANLMGLEPHTLSKNQNKSIEELTPRTRQRLTGLYYVVVSKLGILRPQAIYAIIQTHVFPDLQDRMDSVVSALQQDKYPIETLSHIAELSLKKYQEKIAEKEIPISNAKAISA